MENKIIKKLSKLIKKAIKQDEVPVAAVITYNNKIISTAYNRRNKTQNTIDHAEINAITKANKKLNNWRLNKCTLYTTLEPCNMCKEVIRESRIEKVYYYLSRLDSNKNEYSDYIRKIDLNKNNEKFMEDYKNIFSNFWKNKR